MTSSSSSAAAAAAASECNENTDCSNGGSSSSGKVEPWLISVMTVGGGFDNEDLHGTGSTSRNSSGDKQFTIEVSPEDTLGSLYEQIEATTGLKASQQRLIYRGRLIGHSANNNGSNAAASTAASKQPATLDKIKDIAGLADGQTIHLVKKRDTAPETTANGNLRSTPGSSNSTTPSSSLETDLLGSTGTGSSTTSGVGAGSLLAALLGLSSLTDDALTSAAAAADSTDDAASGALAAAMASSMTGAGRTRRGWRGSRWGSTSRSGRRSPYRLTAEDLQVPDPGSLEPVRQGLMTLHTLLPHFDNSRPDEVYNTPIQANRQWYRGQWIDCCDTVNQWLEATIVEIIYPHEILPPNAVSSNPSSVPRPRSRPPILNDDPAVSANDLEGRRRLLLEPIRGDFDDCDDDLGGDLAGYRPRSNNDGVQLLLIHYNGWPHRWDEWIRSDSERIRPFRTRTRHPNVSSTTSPTPQSAFHEAPRTNIQNSDDTDENDDRQVLLPELAVAVGAVNDMLQRIVNRDTKEDEEENSTNVSHDRPPPSNMNDLPWTTQDTLSSSSESAPSEGHSSSNILTAFDYVEDYDDIDGNDNVISTASTTSSPTPARRYNQQELRNLATLLDRLGRTLTDAAPHVASLAANLPQEEEEEEEAEEDDDGEQSSELDDILALDEGARGPMYSLFSSERRRRQQLTRTASAETSTSPTVDPDHVDYIGGMVNSTRGEVRSGPRSRSSNDDVAGFLGAYLAAASIGNVSTSDGDDGMISGLSQLLRGAGATGGGGGIDIHIHAIVTTPGGGLGVATTGGGGGGGASPGTGNGVTRNLFSSTRRPTTNSILRSSRNNSSNVVNHRQAFDDDDDNGLFSELYSETPAPVNPNGSPGPGEQPRRSSVSDMDLLQSEESVSESVSEYFSRLNTFNSPLRRGEGTDPTSDILAQINQHSSLEHGNVTGVSSTRRRLRRSIRQPTDEGNRTDNANASSNRRSPWGRLFGRRRSSRGPDDF